MGRFLNKYQANEYQDRRRYCSIMSSSCRHPFCIKSGNRQMKGTSVVGALHARGAPDINDADGGTAPDQKCGKICGESLSVHCRILVLIAGNESIAWISP